MKHTLEEKLKFVKLHLKDHVPIYEIKKKYGFQPSTLKYFCKLYEMYGEEPFIKVRETRRKYLREDKLKDIYMVKNEGKSRHQVALEYCLTDPKIVDDWITKYDEEGEEGIKDTFSREAYKHHDDKVLEKEYKKLLEHLEELEAENEYLKKSFPQYVKRNKLK